MQPQTRKITGTVAEARISPGSKSEHRGVVLRTTGGDQFILRRAGGNAFRDEILEALVGTTITGAGVVAGRTFIMRNWTVTKGK
jgi:hypothetical protein